MTLTNSILKLYTLFHNNNVDNEFNDCINTIKENKEYTFLEFHQGLGRKDQEFVKLMLENGAKYINSTFGTSQVGFNYPKIIYNYYEVIECPELFDKFMDY